MLPINLTEVLPRGLAERVRSSLALLPQIGTFVIVSGFVVVQIYLASYSSLYSYDISTYQYISAGISLVIFVPIYAGYVLFNNLARGLPYILVVALVLVSLSAWKVRHELPSLSWRERARTVRQQLARLIGLVSPFRKQLRIFSFLYLMLLALVAGLLYGVTIYKQVPQAFGGGQPVPVVLVFSALDKTTDRWPLGVVNGRSEPVMLLAELSDGILIYDPTSRKVLKIYSRAFDAVVTDFHPIEIEMP